MDQNMSEYAVIVAVVILTFIIATIWLKRKAKKNRK